MSNSFQFLVALYGASTPGSGSDDKQRLYEADDYVKCPSDGEKARKVRSLSKITFRQFHPLSLFRTIFYTFSKFLVMTSIMSQAWKLVKPHIPLIKFRKGGPTNAPKPSSNSTTPSSPSPMTSGAKVNAAQQPVIEDWQLPPRYKRQPLDQKEIDAINSGGAN